MNKEELKKIIVESGVISSYLKHMPPMPYYMLNSDEAIERYKKDSEAFREDNFRSSVSQYALDEVVMWVSQIGGTFGYYQYMNPEAHKNTFSNLNYAQLTAKAQEISVENERLKSAKPLLLKLISSDAKTQWEKNYAVTIEKPDRCLSWVVHDWEKHDTEIKTKNAVLDFDIIQHEEILDVYNEEIAHRKQSPKIKDIIKNMTSIAKDAEKIRLKIRDANIKAQKSLTNNSSPNLKVCSTYIDAITDFAELSHHYSVLQGQLAYFTNETANVPSLQGLTSDETGSDFEIKKTWRAFA